MADLTWRNETRKLGELEPQDDNPRQIRVAQVKRLNESWDDYGQVDLLAVGPNGEMYNGHQRYLVLLDRHGPDYEVECRVSSRPLERREWQRLTVLLHEGATGEWDFDGLAAWDGVEVADLVEWGFEASELGLYFGDMPQRPDFSGLVEEFEPSARGQSEGDEKWFYVEFYGDETKWLEMCELLESHLKGQSIHELEGDFFYGMVKAYLGGNG